LSLDVDLQKDLVLISYDPNKVTTEVMLETVRKQELEGEIAAE
jgi:hypothetical protein